MSSSFKILVSALVLVAFGVATAWADEEKPGKEQPKVVKKEGEKPAKEQPAPEKKVTKEEAAKEKPTKEQPAKEKPEAVKKEGEKASKEQPAPEKKVEKSDKPTETTPAAKRPARQRRDGTMVEAVVKSVDAGKNSITVVLSKNGEKMEQTFTVEKDARLLVAGNRRASLADLKPETRVGLQLSEKKTVTGIRSGEQADVGRKRQQTTGVIKSVDADKLEITVSLRKEGASVDQSLALAKDARIMVAGSEGKISELKPGMRASFVLSEDKKTVRGIRAVARGERRQEKKKEAK